MQIRRGIIRLSLMTIWLVSPMTKENAPTTEVSEEKLIADLFSRKDISLPARVTKMNFLSNN
jgi:hypothetical protein